MTCKYCKTTIRSRDRRIYCTGPRGKVWFCGPCGDNNKIVDRVMNDIEKKAKGK